MKNMNIYLIILFFLKPQSTLKDKNINLNILPKKNYFINSKDFYQIVKNDLLVE